MEKIYKDTAKCIDEICREETFYKSGKDFIRGVLKTARRVRAETGKRIIEGLWKVYGNKCLDLLCDIDIDFGANIEVGSESKDQFSEISKDIYFSHNLKDIFSPLFNIKIAGIKVFKFIIEHNEREEKKKSRESLHIEGDEGTEEGEFGVDWEGMYEEVRSEISKLLQEEKYKEAKEETKRIREIPLEERVKIVKKKYEVIGKISGVTEVEATSKYVNDEADQEKCLRILKNIREGKMKIEDREGYCSGKNWNEEEKSNDPLLKAAKQAIEVNDLPSLITLSKGCFLPSDKSIRLDLENRIYSLFEYSCMVYAVDCALYLLEAGGGIEQKFEERGTPLHQTLNVGNEEIGMFLIERGADCSAIGQFEETVLHAASSGNCFEIAKLLIERGADVKAKDNCGGTPLHEAAEYNSYEVSKLLIERGADIEAKGWREKTPLYYVAINNSVEVAKLLIERGADTEAKDEDGQTPLHWAARLNSYEIAKLLIERGADVKAKDKDGWTPLHWAARLNSYEVSKLLIERGADIEAKEKYGETPLQLTNNDQIRELIREAANPK